MKIFSKKYCFFLPHQRRDFAVFAYVCKGVRVKKKRKITIFVYSSKT